MLMNPKTTPWRVMLPALAMIVCLCGCPPVDPSGDLDRPDLSSNAGGVRDMGGGAPGEEMGQSSPDAATMVELLPGKDVSVATFNVQRLFDDQCDSGMCDAGDFEEVISRLSLNSKVERLQRAIQKIDADVIVLQELEKESLLDEIVEGLDGAYPTAVFGETSFAGSLDVAIISRGSYVTHKKHRSRNITTQTGGTERFAREFLELHVDVQGKRVIVFGAHFISKRSSNSAPRRWAEANAAGEIASGVAMDNPEALVVVAGDLNDTPESAPLQAMASQGLKLPSASVDRDELYTHVFNGERQILDHVAYWPAAHVQEHPDGLRVTRDDGKDGLGNSDHASPKQLFRLVD